MYIRHGLQLRSAVRHPIGTIKRRGATVQDLTTTMSAFINKLKAKAHRKSASTEAGRTHAKEEPTFSILPHPAVRVHTLLPARWF